jgi:hypothetical protein
MTSRRRTAVFISLGLALTAALAGCGSATRNASSSSAGGGAAPAAAPNENLKAGGVAQDGAVAKGGGPAPAKPDLPNASAGRSIIYNGSITVRVDNVTTKAAQLTSLAIGAGGLVSGDERTMDEGKSIATITLRIPAAQFTDVLNQIGKLGKEENRRVSAQDVTAQVVDLNARIQSQQASVDRVRALLARAQSIADITAIEAELARREADLESMQAQQRNLADLTALSTIAVTLLGPDVATPKPAESGFLAGLKAGWKAFAASVRVLLTVLGAVLPFAIAIGVPVWLVVFWLRRRRAHATGTPTGAAPSSATASAKPESTR